MIFSIGFSPPSRKSHVPRLPVSSYNVSTKQGEILTFPVTLSLLSVYSGVFIPMVFEHSGGEILTFPDTLKTLSLLRGYPYGL